MELYIYNTITYWGFIACLNIVICVSSVCTGNYCDWFVYLSVWVFYNTSRFPNRFILMQ